MRIADRIQKTLDKTDGTICDDCLAEKAQLKYRQQAYSRCQQLAREGLIQRGHGFCVQCHRTKIVSYLRSVNGRTLDKMLPSESLATANKPTVKPPDLEAIQNITLEPTEKGRFEINFDFKWVPVLKAAGQPYLFPNPITPEMRKEYSKAAVYRWIPYKERAGDLTIIYVGEADILVRRIANYLKPGPSQRTSIRLHNLFNDMIDQGDCVQLEVLEFAPFTLGDVQISLTDLHSKLARRFIEHMMATYYGKLGFQLINA